MAVERPSSAEDRHTEALYREVCRLLPQTEVAEGIDSKLWGVLRNALINARVRGHMARPDVSDDPCGEPRVYTLSIPEVDSLADAVGEIANAVQALEESSATGNIRFEVKLHPAITAATQAFHVFDLEVTL